MRLQVSATSGTQTIQARTGSLSLASLGLAVGDEIYCETEIDLQSVTGGLKEVDCFVLFNGTSPVVTLRTLKSYDSAPAQAAEASVRRSPTMKIPAGTTDLRFYVWAQTSGAASCDLRVGSVAIVKVP